MKTSRLEYGLSFEEMFTEGKEENTRCENYIPLRGYTGECSIDGSLVNQRSCDSKKECIKYSNYLGGKK